jgi:hypothetical protein
MNENLEAEIVSLIKELQKKNMHQNNTKILDEIINTQRPYYGKSGLGYKKTYTEKGSSSLTKRKEEDHPIRRTQNQQSVVGRTQEEDYRRSVSQRRPSTFRDQIIFN